MIDNRIVRFYTCCKCGYEWTNWDGKNKREGDIPTNCPSCRNLRWNSGNRYSSYTEYEETLIKSIADQHTIWKDPLDRDDWTGTNHDIIDFVAYDFLYGMEPEAELFELKQVAAIPYDTLDGKEQRHELMISMIRDRLYSTDKYAKAIAKAEAHTLTEVRTKVKELSHMKFQPRYYYSGRYRSGIRRPLEECEHAYLMDIFEEALDRSHVYRWNAKYPDRTKVCFITLKNT